MLVPFCDYRHFHCLNSKTLQIPSFPIPTLYHSIVQFKCKPLRRRTSISAAVTDDRALPQSAIRRIAEKLRILGYVEEHSYDCPDETLTPGRNSPGEIFVPLPTRLPKYRVGHTLDTSWSTPENPVPDPGSGNAIQRFHELRRGVLEEEETERIRKRREGKKGKVPTLAELSLPKEELARLTTAGIGLKRKLKVGKAGITEGIVNGIHERWRQSELVRITCEDICRLNMKRTHELLERKTGGLVVWRSGSNIILYRGPNYMYPYFMVDKIRSDASSEESPHMDRNRRILGQLPSPAVNSGGYSATHLSCPPLVQGVGLPNRFRFQLPGEVQLAEEADTLLEGLGPRFKDWWGYDPVPVDADLLTAVVPGFRTPFRLLPYGVQPKLTNDEMTTLRRLGRPLPCHFALGRNRKLQGLAASIIKLWEKCEIAKIAIKRGVQNTNSDMMAEELKRLTGGTLLSRDREFIVFYRGKDFLPAAVSSSIEERRKNGPVTSKTGSGHSKEHKHGPERCGADAEDDDEHNKKLPGKYEDRKSRLSEAAVERTSTKLSLALAKKERAENLLAKLQAEEISQPPELDKEGITEEERYMLRRVGLRMKPFLLLGRRGVFDGTVENMHLHWKYRELVKVCVGKRRAEEIHGIARTLEAESGGILVAIEQDGKGFAIIVYRGKNYKRPASLRPKTLLSKREAMKRAKEAQRRESLKLHVLKLSRDIDEMKQKMAKDEDTDNTQMIQDLEREFDEQNTDNEEKVSHKDHDCEIDLKPSSGECADKISENSDNEMNANEDNQAKVIQTFNNPEDPSHTVEDSRHILQQDLLGVTSQHSVKGNYLFDSSESDTQPGSLPRGTKGFPNLKYTLDKAQSSATTYRQHQREGNGSTVDGFKNTNLEPHRVQKATDENPREFPFRASQLSNKERLILRKQALKMKKPPVLAVGKSNAITGIAKAIKLHFEKHPLAVVNIKGRAKGTSAQEVIYNLEQATGAVLVSQEPSKVILYRGWASGMENNDSTDKSNGRGVKPKPFISPELISAIRLECGFKYANGDDDTNAR